MDGLAMREFLARNGIDWRRPDVEETADTIEQLAARDISEEAKWVSEGIQ
jgi:prophage maintenance system killer protein